MNSLERNKQYPKLHPGFNRKPMKKVCIYHIICKTVETLILDVSTAFRARQLSRLSGNGPVLVFKKEIRGCFVKWA